MWCCYRPVLVGWNRSMRSTSCSHTWEFTLERSHTSAGWVFFITDKCDSVTLEDCLMGSKGLPLMSDCPLKSDPKGFSCNLNSPPNEHIPCATVHTTISNFLIQALHMMMIVIMQEGGCNRSFARLENLKIHNRWEATSSSSSSSACSSA